MNTFFAAPVVDELLRTPWRPVGHCIPAQIGTNGQGTYPCDATVLPATPSPQVSGAQTPNPTGQHPQGASITTQQQPQPPGVHTANAAAAVGLSDLSKVPPPQRPMYCKHASHLTEGLCMIITDAKGPNGLGFSPIGAGVGTSSTSAAVPSPSPAASLTNHHQHSNQLAVADAISTSAPSVRAWVAQLKPEAMLLQLQTNFSHVKVGVPQLLRLIENSLKAGKIAVQFVPSPKENVHQRSGLTQTPSGRSGERFVLRILLPVSVAVSKESSITLSLRVDAFALDEVVSEGEKATCYADFVLQAIVQPMLKTQAALCAALTVLASQGQLRMDEFEAVFRHPVVIQTAAEANISSTPTFWSVVTDAALPRPALPPSTNGEVAYEMATPRPTTPTALSPVHPKDNQPALSTHQQTTPPFSTNTDGQATRAGTKRMSSYVESAEERERKRALAEALNKKNAPVSPVTASAQPTAVATPAATVPTSSQAQLKKIRKAMM